MITENDYFGKWINHPDATPERKANARYLLWCVNRIIDKARSDGVNILDNPNTGCCVSGETYGGFRPQDCPQGSPHSSHKEGAGVDIFDPQNELDDYISKFDNKGHNQLLQDYGLYREHPNETKGWCHLTYRRPGSGNRTFYP